MVASTLTECIFCRRSSETSKSVEHVFPESLGNIDHMLPKGAVCDRCNNYFAVKIEKPLLETQYFINLRFRQDLKNKKGTIPHIQAIANGTVVNIRKDKNGLMMEFPLDELHRFASGTGELLIRNTHNELPPTNDQILSRFIAKIAFESLHLRLVEYPDLLKELYENDLVSELREYSRYDRGGFWPYFVRRIYNENQIFYDESTKEEFQILHEFDFFFEENVLRYIIVVIAGIEYCINPGEREIESYHTFLRQNSFRSIVERDYEVKKGIYPPYPIQPPY